MFGCKKVPSDAKPEAPGVGQTFAPYWEITTEQDGPDGEWEWVAFYSGFPRRLDGTGATREEALKFAKAAIHRMEHRKATRQVDVITLIEEN